MMMRGAAAVLLLLLPLVVVAVQRPDVSEFISLMDIDSKDSGFASADEHYLAAQQGGGQQRVQKLATIPDGGSVPLWKEEGYEPYSDEQDADVTVNGMPEPFGEDSAMTNRYENWKRNYKRVPNEKLLPWDYDGADTNPDMWSSLTKSYQLCDPDLTGPNSSPIDISTLSAQNECYGPSFPVSTSAEMVGHMDAKLYEKLDRSLTVEVMHCKQDCKICKSECSDGPTVAKSSEHPEVMLDRFLVHTPSEHKIDGKALDMEMQFYMCDGAKDYHEIPCIPKMAISVLFKDGGSSITDLPFISKLLGTVPKLSGKPSEIDKTFTMGDVHADIKQYLGEYYAYWGSQTYPPCYQGVEWFVVKHVIPVSSSAIKSLKRIQGENVRPTMPIGSRKVAAMSPEAADHWTYKGPRGQKNWGSFGEISYASCGKTADCEQLPNQAQRDVCLAEQKKQSPVNIVTSECMPNVEQDVCAKRVGLRPVKYDAGGSGAEPIKIYVKDCSCQPCSNPFNGYTVTVVIPGSPFIKYQGSNWVFGEMTFHTPAEHTLDGRRPAMEAQFLLTKQGDAKPSMGVAVHFDKGATSPQWLSDLALIADDATGAPKDLDPLFMFQAIASGIVPFMGKHYIYEGSITTPPCSTGITWLVLKRRLTVTPDDLKVFEDRHVGGNNRETQSLFSREVSIAGTAQL